MVFKRRHGAQDCHIVELKDGRVFDTNKPGAERQAMRGFVAANARHIPYRVHEHFCAFNRGDGQAIRDGFKGRIELEQAMTGREFCELSEINYDAIVQARRADGAENVEFFLSELVNIDSIRRRLHELLQ